MANVASGLKEDRKKVLKRAFSMASGTLTSRVLGLLRDMALGALFDRTVTDAWTAAFRLPNLFRRLLGEGSLGVGFIPVFIEAQTQDRSGRQARHLANAVYTFLLVTLGVLSLLGVIFIEPLFRLILSSEYSLDIARWELTLRLGRIMFVFVYFVGTYAFFMGLLNALGSFALPAVAAGLLNVSMLIFTFLPSHWFAGRADGLAWGVTVGGVLQSTVLGLALKTRGYLPRFEWQSWGNTAAVKVFRGLLPGLIGMGLLQFSTMVNLYYASSLKPGAISAIYWADRLLEFPLSLIAVSIGAALLPKLSEYAAEGLRLEFQEAAEESFLMSLFLAVPAGLGLYFLAEPIIQVLFLRGHFSQSDLVMTATVLRVYALTLILISCSRVLTPLYHAHKNTVFPMVLALISLLLHILLAPLFLRQWGLQGLMMAALFGAFVNAVMLLIGIRRWSYEFNFKRLLKSIGKMVVCAGALSLWLSNYKPVVAFFGGTGVVSLGFVILGAMGIYFFVAHLLRCDEFFKIRPSFRSSGDRNRPRRRKE